MTPHQGRYAAYYRVSTGRQGASGLGLDAQKQKVQDFLDGGRWQLTASFTEIESGPMLQFRRTISRVYNTR
jgi:DNA invertase Pin-like site-specific DNA recombinase